MIIRRDVFQAIADPTRRQIIEKIAGGPMHLNAKLSRPTWYASASPPQHKSLQRTNADGWRTQNEVDRQLSKVQDSTAAY